MKIVVTGAAGFIGSHLCERLATSGHRVVGVDNFDGFVYSAQEKRANAAALMRRIRATDFHLVEADVCDVAVMGQIMSQSVDVVCHLAALAGVRRSLEAPERYMHVNVEGTAVLLNACRRAGVRKVIFSSSSSVYGVANDKSAFCETAPCLQPASPYAASKRSSEILLSTYRDLYGLGATALRFFTVFGPRQRPDMAIHKFVHAIAANRPITIFGTSRSQRDYTYIDDIIDGIVAAIDQVRPGSLRCFNLGGGGVTELGELVASIEEIVGRRAIIEYAPEQKGDVPLTIADISRASAELGFFPKVGVADGLARYWESCQDGQPMARSAKASR